MEYSYQVADNAGHAHNFRIFYFNFIDCIQ